MNSFGIDICEVCGSQSADHAGWFSVAGSGSKLEVLPWNDEVHRRSDCRHACCGEHAEKLVVSAATHDLAGRSFLSTTRRSWDPRALQPASAGKEGDDIDEALVNILSAVDSILQNKRDGDDDDCLIGFDA